jgi:hypothetical protein
MPHILIQRARRTRSRNKPNMPQGATYDPMLGLWRVRSFMLARDPTFVRASKKEDIETGEDRKGR